MLDLSLLICTRNRAHQLAETLKRVAAMQSPLKWELVVVDNGSTDGTSGVVAEYAAACHHPMQTLLEGGRGVSCAKNTGWQSAKSEIVVCIDDDCYPAGDYLDAIYECFRDAPRLGFVGGRILLHDVTDRRITIQESLEPLYFEPDSFIRPGVIQGANVAYRRTALAEVGGFDPWFGGGTPYSGEEAELMARLSAAGWSGAYDPRPLVYHHHGRKTAREEWRLMRWYDRGRGAYYAKCMLNKRMRPLYVKNWLDTRHYHSWKTSALEIVAGLEYLARLSLSGHLSSK